MAWSVRVGAKSFTLKSDVAAKLMRQAHVAQCMGQIHYAADLKAKAIHVENSWMAAEGTIEGDYPC